MPTYLCHYQQLGLLYVGRQLQGRMQSVADDSVEWTAIVAQCSSCTYNLNIDLRHLFSLVKRERRCLKYNIVGYIFTFILSQTNQTSMLIWSHKRIEYVTERRPTLKKHISRHPLNSTALTLPRSSPQYSTPCVKSFGLYLHNTSIDRHCSLVVTCSIMSVHSTQAAANGPKYNKAPLHNRIII